MEFIALDDATKINFAKKNDFAQKSSSQTVGNNNSCCITFISFKEWIHRRKEKSLRSSVI